MRILAQGSTTEVLAVLISYGERENIPEAIAEAGMEIQRQTLAEPGALPPEMSQKLGQFIIDCDARARELFLAEEQSPT